MNKTLAATALAAAIGMAGTMSAAFAQSASSTGASSTPQIVKDNMARAEAQHLVKCYGINALAKNDCAEGAHSCAGQSTVARDPKSYVLLPAGACEKIQGGATKAM